MFKSELVKTATAFLVGIILGVMLIKSGERELGYIMPFYCIGILYGYKQVFAIIGKFTGASARGGFYLTAFEGLWGLTITLTIYIFAISLILALAWLIGIVKCIGALIKAYNQDKVQGNETV